MKSGSTDDWTSTDSDLDRLKVILKVIDKIVRTYLLRLLTIFIYRNQYETVCAENDIK